jgi:hypothetical protein
MQKDQISDFLIFSELFKKGIENKRRGLRVKLFSKINFVIISLWNRIKKINI